MDGHTKLHESEHEAGGIDEIPQGSLLPQDPTVHQADHLLGGADELSGIDATQLGDGRVTNTEYYMLDGVNTASELVTKDELDSVSQGLDWQESVLSQHDPNNGIPTSPGDGDRYLSTATANGWNADSIYEYDSETSSWIETVPDEGTVMEVEDEDQWYAYDGSAWSEWGTMVDHGNLLGLQDNDHDQYLLRDGSNYVTGDILPDSDLSRSLGTALRQFNTIATKHVRAYGATNVEYSVYGNAGDGQAELWITNQVEDGGDIRLHSRNGNITVDGIGGADLKLINDANFDLGTGQLSVKDGEFITKIITQDAEPSLTAGEMAIWNDDVDGNRWLLVNVGGTQYKVELA